MSVESQASRKFTHEVWGNPAERERILAELTKLTSSIPETPPEPKADAPRSLWDQFSGLARRRQQLFRAIAGAVFALASGTEMLNDMSDIMQNNRPEAADVLMELRQHVEEERRRMTEREATLQSIRRAA
ncbi:hypothetical protein KBD61_05330 [Patescibacteria group bacterium]|nr:hypothetical protein [Patescibacteria group bacterium]MBP9710412.1 hypothetical protein [Patescibacteria group bacterium]